MKKNVLALVLVLCMVLSMLPVTVSAAEPQLVTKTAPVELDEMAHMLPGVSTMASYKVSLTGDGHGTTELLVSSTAAAGSEVYFLANPDDGYLAEVYVSGINPEEVYYVGFDMWGFFMPGNNVSIEVKYVAAQGSSHSIKLHSGKGGKAELDRTSAKLDESIYLAVLPDKQSSFNPERHVFATSGMLYYLYQDEATGAHFYELFMPNEDVNIFVEYKKSGPFWVNAVPTSGNQSCTVKIEPQSAFFLDTVTVTITPAEGYRLSRVQAVSHAGDLVSSLTPAGNNKYTFTMHPADVDLYIDTERNSYPVTVSVDTGIGGSASANVTTAKVGDPVTIVCRPDKGYRVAQISGVKNLKNNGNNTYTFTMPAKAAAIKVLFLRNENPFVDVNETHFFYDSVLWAVKNSITNGLDDTHFDPMGACNRAQVVTFLWRYAGSPEPATTKNPFKDVPANDWYTKAVLWAQEQGITTGMTANTFGPNATCNRAQVVTFLWRMMKQPVPGLSKHPFTDVEAGSWYEAPVLWALDHGITTGATSTTFNPNGQCQRAQVVTFLYRTAQLQQADSAE